MCRRELAARDHVVEHEEGRGQEAFAVRKRGKDEAERQKQLRTAVPGGGRASSVTRSAETLEQKFGAQLRPEQQQQSSTQTEEEEKTAVQAPQSNGSARPIQSAASLTSSLPPQLAALRLGRAGGVPTAGSPADASAKAHGEPRTKEFTEEELLPRSKDESRRMLHSPQCSAYFVEPLAWMQGLQQGEISGRLVCPAPRCGVKLGSWDWAGMQCAW